MKNHIIIIFFSFFCAMVLSAHSPKEKAAFEELDKTLKRQAHFMEIKELEIDSLKRQLLISAPDLNREYLLNYALGESYKLFITDSALKYLDRSLILADTLRNSLYRDKACIARAEVLAISGLYKEASADFLQINHENLSPQLMVNYYSCGRQIYSYLSTFVRNDKYRQEYSHEEEMYRDSLISVLPQDSPLYKLYHAEQLLVDGNLIQAKMLLDELLGVLPIDSNLYARTAFSLALIARRENDDAGYATYLAYSAMADVKASVKENAALQYLALYLYEQGDLKRANRYIKYSLDDAIFCNARLRTLEISAIMPVIDAAYQHKLNAQHRQLVIFLVLVSVLSLFLIASLFWIYRQMKKLTLARRKLKQANHIKEEYIGHFLNLCSLYIEKLDNFRLTVNRKIMAGQTEELLRMTKSASHFAGMGQKEFYANFDNAFLQLYPNFVDHFNSLLVPEERFVMKHGELLNTEMRIYAIIRLGIDDSSKIANFLHYSVNTIYTYRNKVKNKAINRDNFENDVLRIDSIE